MAARCLDARLHECDWSLVNKASLQGMSADARGNLENILTRGAQRDIVFLDGSRRLGFVRQRVPLPLGEVAKKVSTEDDLARALALVKSQAFQRAVESFRRTEGISPHPAVAYRIAVAEEKEHSKPAKVAPRASAPRKKRKVSAGEAKRAG